MSCAKSTKTEVSEVVGWAPRDGDAVEGEFSELGK